MNNFKQFKLNGNLLRALRAEGIVEPTEIQKISIPKALEGKDILGQAQTGTGKTLAFLLPIFEKINKKENETQVLIITPTRELTIQIYKEAQKLNKYTGLKICSVYGGENIKKQFRQLKRGNHIIIATPGRLLDHIKRKTVNLKKLDFLVLDEADEMVNMGFIKDIERIIKYTPETKQTLLYSATIPKEVRGISKKFMREPSYVKSKEADKRLEQIEEIKIRTTNNKKEEELCKYIDEHNPYMGIIFCRTKRRVTDLKKSLRKKGYSVDEIHGDLNQNHRERALRKFQKLETQFLIGTDVLARGIDIEGVTHVFNYDEPEDKEIYTHRIGRTGRAGKKGTAVTFITSQNNNRGGRKFNSKKNKSNKSKRRKKNKYHKKNSSKNRKVFKMN